MRKVIVNEFMSLDGVVQAPGGVVEDTSGGFGHGGWHLRYFDDLSQKRALESIVEAGGFLLGRRTYEIFAAYWPNAPQEAPIGRQRGDDDGGRPRDLRSGRRLTSPASARLVTGD